jgi:hypothetical protein
MVGKGGDVMKVKTSVTAGALTSNHNEALARPAPKKTRTK